MQCKNDRTQKLAFEQKNWRVIAESPGMDEVPLIEPLICKKVAAERLTVICFRRDCLVTACADGFVTTWKRPNSARCL